MDIMMEHSKTNPIKSVSRRSTKASRPTETLRRNWQAVPIRFPLGMYSEVKAHTLENMTSMQEFMLRAAREQLLRDRLAASGRRFIAMEIPVAS